MVERIKPGLPDTFVGKVEDVLVEPSQREDIGGEQYHIVIKPEDIKIEGKTGMIHEWIRIPPKATESAVPEGSVLDRYLAEIELLIPEAKQKQTHFEVFALIKGKKFKWVKKKLGKSFGGYEAHEYWVPAQVVE